MGLASYKLDFHPIKGGMITLSYICKQFSSLERPSIQNFELVTNSHELKAGKTLGWILAPSK